MRKVLLVVLGIAVLLILAGPPPVMAWENHSYDSSWYRDDHRSPGYGYGDDYGRHHRQHYNYHGSYYRHHPRTDYWHRHFLGGGYRQCHFYGGYHHCGYPYYYGPRSSVHFGISIFR